VDEVVGNQEVVVAKTSGHPAVSVLHGLAGMTLPSEATWR
jgi:chemotaxis protein histidine kinase CheA